MGAKHRRLVGGCDVFAADPSGVPEQWLRANGADCEPMSVGHRGALSRKDM